MGEKDTLPPSLVWPTDWKPRVQGSSISITLFLGAASYGVAAFAGLPLWAKFALPLAAVLLGVFQKGVLACVVVVLVAWKRILYYERLHAYSLTLQHDLIVERTIVERLAQHQLTQEQIPSLAILDAMCTAKDGYVIVIEKNQGLMLSNGSTVLAADLTTSAIMATFLVVEERATDYLARIVDVRPEGALWWGYIHLQVDRHAAINTKVAVIPLDVRGKNDGQ